MMNMRCITRRLCAGLLAGVAGLAVASGWTQELSARRPELASEPDSATPQESLASKQEAIALRYQRFETTLLQLAEYLRKTDPDRAELLVRAIGKSKEGRIADQFDALVRLLKNQQLGDALDNQQAVLEQLQLVLTLLQSEDRHDEIERERQRLRGLIKEVDKLVLKQTDVRSATERGAGATDQMQDQQRQVSDSTQKLLDKIAAQDAARNSGSSRDSGKPSGKPSSTGKPAEKPPEDPAPSESGETDKPMEDKPATEGQQSEGGNSSSGKPEQSSPPKNGKPPGRPQEGDKPKDGSPKNGDMLPEAPQPEDESNEPQSPDKSPKAQPSGAPSQSSKPQKNSGKPKPGQNGQPMDESQTPPPPGEDEQSSQPSDNPQDSSNRQQQRTPGRQELEQARRDMEDAIQELKKKQKDKASDKQDQALADLLKAKERLEEILRQLREEERELVLAALEARFRDMLGRQINVLNGTVGLAAIPSAQQSDKHRNRSVELARSEEEIALLAAKALTLLREEGSSIAFPEALVQLREDMLIVARRLERVDVGDVTVGIEKDIIESLEEMLEALQKELEKAKDKKQQQQQQQQGQPTDPGLVDTIAELKMLRSLQYRVNRRTKQFGRLVDGEQAADPDLARQLQSLSQRQAKIQQSTYDLATGRNK